MEIFLESAKPIDETLSLRDVVGKRVLTKSGAVIGRVKSVHMGKTGHKIEGVVVRRFFRRNMYICATYVDSITPQGVILSIVPATLLEGRKVISKDGKTIGQTKKVHRVGDTNKISSLTVKRGWFRTMDVLHSHIHQIGDSITLSKTQEQLKDDRKKR